MPVSGLLRRPRADAALDLLEELERTARLRRDLALLDGRLEEERARGADAALLDALAEERAAVLALVDEARTDAAAAADLTAAIEALGTRAVDAADPYFDALEALHESRCAVQLADLALMGLARAASVLAACRAGDEAAVAAATAVAALDALDPALVPPDRLTVPALDRVETLWGEVAVRSEQLRRRTARLQQDLDDARLELLRVLRRA